MVLNCILFDYKSTAYSYSEGLINTEQNSVTTKLLPIVPVNGYYACIVYDAFIDSIPPQHRSLIEAVEFSTQQLELME